MSEIMLLNPAPGWNMYRLGQLFNERREKVSDKDYAPLSVTMNGIVPQLDSAAKSDDGDNRKLVRAGDYVINSRSDRKGSGGISPYDGSVSLISIVLEPKRIDPAFAHHLLRSAAFQEEFYRWGHGIVADLWTTRYSDMKNIRLYVPDLATQRQIADFLDRETARIDLLIEKKQRLVALLGDHWNRFTFDLFSLEMLTRFKLDKSEWQHQKLKFLSPQVTVGIVVTPAAYYTDDGVPAIRGTNIRAMDIRLDDMVSITDEGHRINKKSAIVEGDVVVVRTGQPGTAAVVPKALDGANCIDVILIKKSEKYLSDLLAYFLNSPAAKAQYSSSSSGAIQQHFNISIASNLIVPMPPLREQDRVLAILGQEGQRVRKLTSTLQNSITRLREYRSALITAAVTGQINVQACAKFDACEGHLSTLQ